MRERTLAIAGALIWLAATVPASAQPAGSSPPQATPLPQLTLPEALARAEQANPVLLSKSAQLAAAEGQRTDASALLYNNPELSMDQRRRSLSQPSAERQREWGAGISQTFEIAGQRGYRRESAEAALSALRLEIADTRRQVRAEVAQRFARLLALQQRIDTETQALRLFENTATAVQRRRQAGEDTKLDANVARVEAERARNQLALAQEQLIDARAALAALLQLPPDGLPQAIGELALQTPPYSLDTLLAAAQAQPRLRALSAREASADARLQLERASVYPDVTVGMSVGRDGPSQARERLTTLSVSVPLPLFRRNAAGIGQASTELTQVQIERQAAARDTRADVQALWVRLASLETRVRRLQDSVLPSLIENQQLSLKSQQAGQIGLLELIVVNRQSVDARRDLLEALIDYHSTRIALELAAGWPQEAQP